MSVRVVFDLDGTLIDSAPDIRGVANAVLAGEGHPPITMDETRAFIGDGVGVFVTKMRAARGIAEDRQDPMHAAFMARYHDAVGLTRPYPGVTDALDRLRADGHRLGICTNKPVKACRAVLCHLGLEGYFDTMWGGDSLPQRKPDPAPLRAAFRALGDGPSAYVGDSDVDAETARRAGAVFLLFSRGYRKSPVSDLPHTAAFDTWADLPDLVAAHAR